jgi:hypothetical protein
VSGGSQITLPGGWHHPPGFLLFSRIEAESGAYYNQDSGHPAGIEFAKNIQFRRDLFLNEASIW